MPASAPIFKFLAHLPPLPDVRLHKAAPLAVNSGVPYMLSAWDITYDDLAMNKGLIRAIREFGTIMSIPKS